jgi:arylsulfatase A-like enzyme
MSRAAIRIAAAFAALSLPCCGDAARAPDLILISVDTLRADRLPCYGAARDTAGDPAQDFTPAWLAAHGTVHDACWASAGQTLPSLGSFWTGRPPLEHGATSNMEPVVLPTRLVSLKGTRFDSAHALLANQSLGPGCGLRAGFDNYGLLFKHNEPRIPAEMLRLTQPDVASGKRLLVWAHFMAPHQPYAPAPALADRYGPGDLAAADNEFLYGLHRAGSMDAATRAALERLYDAEVRTASGYVQELLAGLDRQYRDAGRGGLLENAVVVFFSDHGEALGDHFGYSLHAKSLYSGVIRVPLVVAGPGWKAARSAQPIALAEVLPLVLDGLTPRSQYFHSAWRAEFYAVRDARWTLVHNPTNNRIGPREPPEDAPFPYPLLALYDRDSDPREQHDVAAQHPDEARRLLREAGRWYASLQIAAAGASQGLDPLTLSQLGYADALTSDRSTPLSADSWEPSPPPR